MSADLRAAGSREVRVEARLSFSGGEPDVVVLDLSNIRGRWRVSDVHEAGAPSLVRFLSPPKRDVR